MKRRDFLQLAAISPLLAMSPAGRAAPSTPLPGWRTFELVYTLDLSAHPAPGRVWLPLPANAGDYQRVLSTRWQSSAANAALYWNPVYQAPVFSAEWNAGENEKTVTLTSRVATRDRSMAPPRLVARSMDEVAFYLKPTEHMPVDGIVAKTSDSIVRGIEAPDDKARALYDWVVEHSFRDPATRGCGMGNIQSMLETGNLGGEMRRHQFPLCRPGAGRRSTGSRNVRRARGRFATVAVPWQVRRNFQGATLPRRVFLAAPRLGSSGSGGCTQGGSGNQTSAQ